MRFELPTMDEIRGAADPSMPATPMQLPLDDIEEDPEQPRQEFDPQSLAELAATIAARGVRQPVSVRRHPAQPGRWMLNFGARRLRAARLAGARTIAAFEDATADSYDQVIENEQREGLKPLEIALFIERQLACGQSRAEIARRLGKSQAYVTYACSLIEPPDWLLELYRRGACRGMFELHELRRMHAIDAEAVEAAIAATEHFGRVELKLLKARLAERSGHSDGSDRPRAMSPSVATDSAAIAPPRPHFDDAGPARPVRVPRSLVLRARHDGASVRVVLDALPDAPDAVFVLSGEGTRVVAAIDSLDGVEILIGPAPAS